jgi:hypothetical protein
MAVVLNKVGDFYTFNQKDPARFVTKLTGWAEDTTGDPAIVKREFRWNTNNRVRTPWIELTVKNLENVILNPDYQLFVDFRYTLISPGSFSIESVRVEFEQSAAAADPYLGYFPPLLVSDKGNVNNLTYIPNFSFKPYQVNPAVVLYKALSKTINLLFGHDVSYARAVPDEKGKDVVLHEWNLYSVDEPVCIKVLVPNNEFPDSKLNFADFGIDFEMPFEVNIDKDYFEEVFGVGVAPQRRDIIYFGLENRIYEVESTYLYKDIMRREVYWKVALKKYSYKTNRYEPQDLREAIDVLSADTEELFGAEVTRQEIDITKPQQYDPKIGSRDYDPIREDINDALLISQEKVENHSILISESQYDLRSISKPGEKVHAVTYKADVVFPSTEDRSLTAWFRPVPSRNNIPKDRVNGQLNVSGSIVSGENYLVTYLVKNKREYVAGDKMQINRYNGVSLYGELAETPYLSGSNYVYSLYVHRDIVDFLNVSYPGWSGGSYSSGYFNEQASENTLLEGIEGATGWRFTLFARRYFVLEYYEEGSLKRVTFPVPQELEESWHAFYLNISNYYSLVSLDLWRILGPNDTGNSATATQLYNTYTKTVTGVTASDRSANRKYELLSGDISLTNIRLFKEIETDPEKQIIILNQAIVQDASLAEIIDNAKQRLRLPWIGSSK